MYLFIKILFIFGCTVYSLLLGLSLVAAGGESSLAAVCGAQPLQCKLSRCGHGLSRPVACGIFLAVPLALAGGFLSSVPPGACG